MKDDAIPSAGDVFIAKRHDQIAGTEPTGEVFYNNVWRYVLFEPNACFLVLSVENEGSDMFIADIVSLENAARFMFKSHKRTFAKHCDIMPREFPTS